MKRGWVSVQQDPLRLRMRDAALTDGLIDYEGRGDGDIERVDLSQHGDKYARLSMVKPKAG